MVCPCNHIVAIWTVSCRHDQPLKHWKFSASVLSLKFLFLPHFSHLLFVSPKNKDLSLCPSASHLSVSFSFFLLVLFSFFISDKALCLLLEDNMVRPLSLSPKSSFSMAFYLFIICENEIRKYLNYQKKSKNGITILLTFKHWLHMNGYISLHW